MPGAPSKLREGLSASARAFTLTAPAEAMGPVWLTQGASLRRAARKWGWKLRVVRGPRLCLRQKDSVAREPASGAGPAVVPSPGAFSLGLGSLSPCTAAS